MKWFKFFFEQFVTITAFIVTIVGITFLFDPKEYIPGYVLVQIALVGFLSTLPSVVFISKEEYTKKSYIIRTIIHFILLNIIVLSVGYAFDFYNSLIGGISVFITILIIYVIVTVSQLVFNKNEADKINKILLGTRDEE